MLLPKDSTNLNEILFSIIYKSRNIFTPNETYFVEINVDLPILEMLSDIFAETEIHWKICPNSKKKPTMIKYPYSLTNFVTVKKTCTAKFTRQLKELKNNSIGNKNHLFKRRAFSNKCSIERFHSILLEMIGIPKFEHPDEHLLNVLPYTLIAYNTSKNKNLMVYPL